MENHTCNSCHNSLPATATFCPFCGVGASKPAPYNDRFESNLAAQVEEEVDYDYRPGVGPGVKLFAGVAITGAVIVGIFAGSWLADVVNRPAEVPAPVAAAVETPKHEAHPEVAVSTNEAGGFDVMVGAEVLHTVKTSEASRYPNLDERMRSVAVRFKHVQNKEDGRYAARLVGDHYEVVWAGPDGDFRLLDVTPKDVEGSTDGADFAANLLVDRLNATLPPSHNS